ncbi:ribose 1,5-bisphosphate isomerase [Methanoculleus sp. YWC-01]|uniref:Ribose 1,5-bisphosphate isomerase n=1 Tax=Methanoculleus nereidis TaxID=2735141 RepID=A0ABU3Z1Q0_9EURY|nr:ribose 1,5-bisphosphate isomerase [Methanoculleus sp. YWC-01]MDV4342735.1 ribose 1,5-bisphosphate isomerase [Methanoculleus sp. YWC-01]
MLLSGTAASIKNMEIRGAGRIARAAVEALADYAENLDVSDPETFKQEMQKAADILTATRPTAVSLPNAVRSVMRALDSFDSVGAARDAVLARAAEFVDHSEHAVERIAAIGARHISDGDVLLTHCNSEAALGCILEAHRQGKEFEVYATEVRPRGQGLITIRTLNDAGIRTNYIVDSAVRYFINDVDLVVVGADAIAVNGAVVNKIGTAQIAHAAHEARTNVIVAAETYKFAPRTILGELIEIEERDPDEVLPREAAEELPFVRVRNPAFDVTPAEYIDLIVTEQGAIPPGLAFTVIRDYLGWRIEELR